MTEETKCPKCGGGRHRGAMKYLVSTGSEDWAEDRLHIQEGREAGDEYGRSAVFPLRLH